MVPDGVSTRHRCELNAPCASSQVPPLKVTSVRLAPLKSDDRTGEPTAWNVSTLGEPAAVVHLKFKLRSGPARMCDSRVPVEGCDPSTLPSDFINAKVSIAIGMFSVDDTGVDPVFAGSLFASVNADMRSLAASPIGSPKLALTYAVSGMSDLGGSPNSAEFYAFVSDNSLVNYFGVTPDILALPEFATSETLKVMRADGGASEASTWSRWSPETNGSSGYFLSVDGVQFNGKSVAASRVGASALKRTYPAKFVMGKKVANRVSVRRSGSRQVLTLTATTTKCRTSACRWVVSKSASRLGTKMSRLATVSTRTGNATVSVTAKKGPLLSVVLQNKVKGKWKFVTSRMVVGR